MMALYVQDLCKAYGEKVVLEQVSFLLNGGERVGLVGPNGVGKTTIIKILTGDLAADQGTVTIPEGVEVGYLPQHFDPKTDRTIAEWIFDSQRALRAMEQRMNELATQMTTVTDEDALAAVIEEYGEISARFEQRGGYEMEYRTEVVLAGLKLSQLDTDRPLSTLSGGQKTRVGLAALLISSPDLLLLDEPTNHLDFATMAWLEDFLTTYKGAILLISHDRQFLNRTVTQIWELEEHKRRLKEYAGNYDQYLLAKQKARLRWQEAYERQQEEIRDLRLRMNETGRQVGHNRPIKDHNKMAYNRHGTSVQNTISRNIRAAEKQLERIMENPVPAPPQPLRFQVDFDAEKIGARTALMGSHLRKVLPDGTVLFDEVNLALSNKSRVLIQGPNGSGKTTLLRLLAGQGKADDGSLSLAPAIMMGYLEQEIDYADGEQTVLDHYREGLVGSREEQIARLISSHLFRYEELSRRVDQLSPGQYRKLQLAKLIASGANLLLLDEPTNHLSLDVMEEFEQALLAFPGPILVVSHDRWFIQRFQGEFGGEVWEMADGRLSTPTTANYSAQEEAQVLAQLHELSAYDVMGKQHTKPL
ncbi:MAG TPA: ABC-F family ATP-binding cassette domain-containing protein [Bacilli bacterium]|nr:ABC-F family ATP-binding cassette domain-containing protein [Bacilli bacterium]